MITSRRTVRRYASAVCVLSLARALAGCDQAPPRPDILLVTIDTLRSDHCSAYGYPIATTPNLDALAARGVRYHRAYSECATTAPSHSVLLTGRHFRTLGMTKNGKVLPRKAVTLAEALHGAGYATAGFISAFPLQRRFGFSQGFEVFNDATAADPTSKTRRLRTQPPEQRVAGATVDRVERFLAQRKDDRPLFMWVHFFDPHAPYDAPERLDVAWPPDTSDWVRRYDEEVHYADKQLGRLLGLFAAQERERPDLVVVTSDHGEGLGDHDWMLHGINLYEEAVRVPLVASWPGVLSQGKVVGEPVGLIDVSRGILALLQIPAPTFAHGRKLFAPPDPHRRIYLQRREYESRRENGRRVRGPMTGVVDGSTKLILAPVERKRELYDLGADPRELTNLVARRNGKNSGASAAAPAADSLRARHEATARALKSTLARWETRHPAAATEAPIDEEAIKALRSLGYVD